MNELVSSWDIPGTPKCPATYSLISCLTYISQAWYYAGMEAFDVLGDPVRRRILELLADNEPTSGAITSIIQKEFGISQPAVSQHLRVLREAGFATVRADGTRRLYSVSSAGLQEVDTWLRGFRHLWDQPLDALETELARGRPKRLARGNDGRGSTSGKRPKERKEEL